MLGEPLMIFTVVVNRLFHFPTWSQEEDAEHIVLSQISVYVLLERQGGLAQL